MSTSAISTQLFKKRLVALCTSGGGRGMPSHPQDLLILLKSMALYFESATNYSEKAVNERLKTWLLEVGQNVEIDHASLRRYLVDAGWLNRDTAGKTYALREGWKTKLFVPEVDQLAPADIIQNAIHEAQERKQRYLASQANAL